MSDAGRQYENDFRTLNAPADCDWHALRSQYRRLVQGAHPDRISDPDARRHAEETIKRINQAFGRLSDYYKRHGNLPRLAPPTSPTSAAPKTSTTRAGALFPWRRVTLAILALGAGTYGAHTLWAPTGTSLAHSNSAKTDAPIESPLDPLAVGASTATITHGIRLGSTPSEVFAVQGAPTHADGDVWHYGESRIHFAHNAVVRIEPHPRNPLQLAASANTLSAGFQVGSTKAEVRALQGRPLVETATVWDYGNSRVYFRDERVSGWHDSPYNPLKLAR